MSDPTAPDGDDGERLAPLMPSQLAMVVISARDLPALRRYYQALGWPEQPGGSDSLCTFELGGVALTLYPQSEPLEPKGSTTADRPSVTLVVRVGAGDAVDAACGAALRAGAQVIAGPQGQPWGGRAGIVADPEGNRWEVLWVPRPGPGASPGTGAN